VLIIAVVVVAAAVLMRRKKKGLAVRASPPVPRLSGPSLSLLDADDI